jgi:hypothetical protein
MSSLLKQVVVAPDGTQFDNMKDAEEYLRKPKVIEALMDLTSIDEELSEWLYNQQELLEESFAVGSIRRFRKSDKKAYEKDLNTIKEKFQKELPWLAEHGLKINISWPKQRKIDETEKNTLIINSLAAARDEETAKWCVENQTKLMEAFEAGKEKREAPKEGTQALFIHHTKMAILKGVNKEGLSLEDAVEALDKEKHTEDRISEALKIIAADMEAAEKETEEA